MARFSNGTEGMIYQEQYCERCINYRDAGDGRDFGCPVWDAHLLYCDETEGHQAVLDLLIPMDGLFATECTMFMAYDTRAVDPNQNELPFAPANDAGREGG